MMVVKEILMIFWMILNFQNFLMLTRSTLDLPISKSELYKTLVSMKQNKTPGFDGFPVEFFILFWQDVSDRLIDSYNFSLKNGLLPLSQRNGIITLLSKKDKDPLLVRNYRPITLLTVDYKIIAKTLANRLRLCINDIIHSDQSGFIKGRNIGDNIRLIWILLTTLKVIIFLVLFYC